MCPQKWSKLDPKYPPPGGPKNGRKVTNSKTPMFGNFNRFSFGGGQKSTLFWDPKIHTFWKCGPHVPGSHRCHRYVAGESYALPLLVPYPKKYDK